LDPGKLPIRIKSTANPRVKFIRSLHKRTEREASGLFVIEVYRELSLALKSGVEIVEVFFHPDSLVDESTHELAKDIAGSGARLTPVSKKVMERISYRETSSIFVALARRPELSIENLPRAGTPLYLVADSIEKPGNIGAILRTADGCGASGVIITPEDSDPFNPNAVRASLGTVFTVPLAVVSVDTAVAFLKNSHTRIVAATPGTDDLYTDVDMRKATAIVVGSEDRGLGEQWLKAADSLVRIPMKGQCDSLNVSVSAAIIMYEALRQRMQAG